MIVDAATGAALDQAADPGNYARATLNILADFSDERAKLADVQKAMLNILEDSGAEKFSLEAAQKATLNILADFSDERAKLADVQKAVLNILEDFAGEKARLEATQKAVLNILDDFDTEKNKVEQINREMAGEITERKQAEEALEAANKELEAFSYSVSHDLRAPLRAIDGFSRILIEEHAREQTSEAQEYLHLVRENTLKMGRLVDDLLAFSRLGRQPLKVQHVEPADLVRHVLEDLRNEQEGRRIEVSIGDLPSCQADPALLKQVWVNLLSNAIKYTRTREPARIEIGYQQTAAEQIYFVRDNGVGFDMKYANKLFGVFQRLHRAEEYEGTGVGLAIVQRIIQRHGGRVWAEAEVDKGTIFYFTIEGEKNNDR